MNTIGPAEIIVLWLILFVPFTILWIYGLVDALRIPDPIWDAAGQNKILYVVLMAVVGLLGTILYFAIARPPLKRAQAAR